MEKRKMSSLRIVQKTKKKPIKKQKHRFFRKVMAYLTSDSYMFAPLLSSHHFHSSGVGTEGLLYEEKRNKTTLMGKVADFLKSDCYLYAPLIAPRQSSDCSSNNNSIRGTSTTLQSESPQMEAAPPSAGKLVEDREPPSKEMERKQIEDKQPDSYSPAKSVLRKKVEYRETMKHMVQLKCRSSSVPGVLHEMEPAKLLVE